MVIILLVSDEADNTPALRCLHRDFVKATVHTLLKAQLANIPSRFFLRHHAWLAGGKMGSVCTIFVTLDFSGHRGLLCAVLLIEGLWFGFGFTPTEGSHWRLRNIRLIKCGQQNNRLWLWTQQWQVSAHGRMLHVYEYYTIPPQNSSPAPSFQAWCLQALTS